jgi:hypothetical protein
MLRISAIGLLALAGWTPPAAAQIVIRAPFVRVQVGGGVSVQAPFVNFSTVRPYLRDCAPAGVVVPSPQPRERVPAPTPEPPVSAPPAAGPPTLGEFARSFQPRAGTHEIVVVNPVTNAPATVQFALPAGTPGVRVFRRELDFVYDGGQWVRIRFDRLGVRVSSR